MIENIMEKDMMKMVMEKFKNFILDALVVSIFKLFKELLLIHSLKLDIVLFTLSSPILIKK